MKVPITVACWEYDRTRALFDGRVAIEGCDTNLLNLPVEETFFRALNAAEFDVAELSFSSYTMLRSRGTCPYVAIPVFLSRSFRHSGIYIRTDLGIDRPEDLAGRPIGTPEYQLTAGVWQRGLLQDRYGVAPSAIEWWTGGVEESGRREKVPFTAPTGTHVKPIPDTETLTEWLRDGRIHALIAPREPRCFIDREPNIGRLFPDFATVERDYFDDTKIFPIMHVVGIRESLVAEHPWLPSSVFKAFVQAKRVAENELRQQAALKVMLPWLVAEYESTVERMGSDWWSYGIRGSERTLDAFVRYHHEQGLSGKRAAMEDLFAASTLDMARI
ncbi:ABC transporter substrate-binding protein [Burkholderia anthina]|uniref:ABC transporter substrate-binding protein n=1 Tax=Burkholderia anthina TaxID=179879 RepID=UPI00158BEC99|nr:ABC transporter substrate-binding protein [Burkholderia anthina]